MFRKCADRFGGRIKLLLFEEVLEILTALRDLPGLLDHVEQSDRAALYQALWVTVMYRRIGSTEEVKVTSTLRGVDLKGVGGDRASGTS